MKRRRKPIKSPSNAPEFQKYIYRRNKAPSRNSSDALNHTTTSQSTATTASLNVSPSSQNDTSTQSIATSIPQQIIEEVDSTSHMIESQHTCVDSITAPTSAIVENITASTVSYATQFSHPHLPHDLLMYIE